MILILSCLLGCSTTDQRYALVEGNGTVMLVDQKEGKVWMYASNGRFTPIEVEQEPGSHTIPTEYRVKRSDFVGVDPITFNPEEVDGQPLTGEEVFELTLLNIIRENRLVTRLDVFGRYSVPATVTSDELDHAELTVDSWSPAEQEAYFRAAAIVLETIKELNPDLTYESLRMPGSVIVLPQPETF